MEKVKTQDSASTERGSGYVTGNTPASAPLAAAESMLKSTSNVGDSKKCLDSWVDNAEEECQTPKSEEHKILQVLCCPPPPCKPRSLPVGRMPPAGSLEAFCMPSDSDMHWLFGSDPTSHRHMKKKR